MAMPDWVTGKWLATSCLFGIPALVEAVKETGVKFGIWIEPEMVNPKSELFEKSPDWAIMLPNRETYYYRNQLVLDLSNPKVQDYVYGVVENIMSKNPDVAFLYIRSKIMNTPFAIIHIITTFAG